MAENGGGVRREKGWQSRVDASAHGEGTGNRDDDENQDLQPNAEMVGIEVNVWNTRGRSQSDESGSRIQ